MNKDVAFVKSVHNVKDIPKRALPEIVLGGRSNVGKSSFINSFFNRKGLAKISSSPGKTRSVNYYIVDDKYYLVDLPGYGYAKASKGDIAVWSKLTEDYMNYSTNIRLVLHLIDSRIKVSPLDIHFNGFLKSTGFDYAAILTKVDKLKQSDVSASVKRVEEVMHEFQRGDNLILYSSPKRRGVNEVNNLINRFLYDK